MLFRDLLPALVVLGTLISSSGVQAASGDLTIEKLELISANQLEVTLVGPTNRVFVLEASTNFLQWSQFEIRQPEAISQDGRITIQVVPAESSPYGFYRALHLAPTPDGLIDQLEGPAEEPANLFLPELAMPDETAETVLLVNDEILVSGANILAAFNDETTIEQANSFLQSFNAQIAGAIPVMEVIALRVNLNATADQLDQTILALKASGLFKAVAVNIGMSEPVPSGPPSPQLNRIGNETGVADWTWEITPPGTGTGGNNALEMSRIPQLWNWLDFGRRQVQRNGAHPISIMEYSFYSSHEDLPPNVESLGTAPSIIGRHGVGVLGVAAANGTNIVGLQGVTPLADPVRAVTWQTNPTGTHALSGSRLGDVASQICRANPSRVINVSSGIPYSTNPTTTLISTNSSRTYANWMDDLGDLWSTAFQSVNTNCTDKYLIMTSAGNDGVDTRYNHPIANIACRKALSDLVPNFLTVENLRADGTTNPGSNRDVVTSGDNAGHAVSAGGTSVGLMGNASSTSYRQGSGTSYAAPFVAGLASLLWTLDPDLTVTQLKSLLMNVAATRQVAGSTSDLVDGFAAALHIDIINDNHKLQEALVDVDDGTLDGNLRKTGLGFEQSPDTIHTSDKRRGDGKVTMSDFRGFRDAYLEAVGLTDYLDGPASHFKRDLNFDGIAGGQPVAPAHPKDIITPSAVNGTADENLFSRYDFNGNGRIDAGNILTVPNAEDVSPFKVDPETNCAGRDPAAGCLVDLDVLLDPDIWEITDENFLVEGGGFTPPLPGQIVPDFDWAPSNVRMTNLFFGAIPLEHVPSLWSCDLHISMESTDPNSPFNIPYSGGAILQADGLWITSANVYANNRGGEWDGVMTFPLYHPVYHPIKELPVEAQSMLVQYKKTVGQEWRQYLLNIYPGPGEDVLMELGFDKISCSSTKRNTHPDFIPRTRQFEVLAKLPDSPPYTTVVVPDGDPRSIGEIADELAATVLSSRLRLPPLLNGGASLEALYDTERVGDSATRILILGISANYE